MVRIEELEKEIVWLKKTHNEEIINKDTRIEQMDEEINKLIKIINQDREQSRGLEVEIARLEEELAGVRFAERSNETKERDREG